jgi:hypothetical protein
MYLLENILRNAKSVHSSVQWFVAKNKMAVVLHSPYFMDLASYDFLFYFMKLEFKGRDLMMFCRLS